MRGKGCSSVGDLSQQQVQDLEYNSWHWRERVCGKGEKVRRERRKGRRGQKKEEGGKREEMEEETKEKNEWVNN